MNMNRAFSLLETIVVIAVSTMVMGALSGIIVYFYKTNAYALEQSTAVAHARRGVEDAMHSLRSASYGSDGSYPVEVADENTIVFYANVDSNVDIERVSYLFHDSIFEKLVVSPAGSPPSYGGAPVESTTVAEDVVNDVSTPVFRYFDKDGLELAQPVDVSLVASVTTTLVVDVNTARAPISFTLQSAATLRNLKSQL